MSKPFDPNAAAAINSGIFGLPYSIQESDLILLPVSWEATTSYGGGTSRGPQAIFDASYQVDLFDLEFKNFFEKGIAWVKEPKEIQKWNALAKRQAMLSRKKSRSKKSTADVNKLSEKLNDTVYKLTKKYLDDGKIVGLVGGDHSTPFGCIQAHLEKYPEMGILHFDAHADLRNCYQGFEHSHASIMFNVTQKLPLKKLVQVGIRDFCEEEFNLIQSSNGRIKTFFDLELAEKKSQGKTWAQLSEDIVESLPNQVYVSFDIDGLDPMLCPHTGTPVPGGLQFNEAVLLLKTVLKSGRKIIGFDLNEVTPGPRGDEWDANVGARLLYKLCGTALT